MKQLEEIYQAKPNAAMVVLEYLNIRDITTMIPKLKQFKYMDRLSLHGNKLTYLPSLQILDQLKELDISNNPIKIDNRLMDSLFNIPKLQSLIIDIKSQQQRSLITQNLPKLNYLNQKPIIRKKQEKNLRQEEIQIIKSKLSAQQQNVKSLLNNIYNMLDETKVPPDSSEQITFSLKCIVEEFQYFYQNINSSLARQCVYLYYKSKLYQVVDSHLTNFLEDNDQQSIANAIDQINKFKKQGFQEILKVILSHAYEEDFSKKTVQPGNKLRKQTLYQNEITRLKKQVSDLMKENQQLHYSNERAFEKLYFKKNGVANKKTKQNHSLRASINASNIQTPASKHSPITPMSKSPSKNQIVRTASKRQFNFVQQQNQTPIKNSYKKQRYQEIDSVPNYKVIPKSRQPQQSLENFQKTNSLGSFSANRLKPSFSTRSISRQPNNQQQIKRSPSKHSISNQGEKKLTLDQMVQFVDQFIYEKGKFNIQCQSKGQLYQTPQEFLYTYFLRKYGLKDMALEWSLLIIKAIQKYSKENIIVEVFGKILKNTLEEQFYVKCKKFNQYLNPSVPLKDTFNSTDVRQIFFNVFPDAQVEQFQRFISKLQYETSKGQRIYSRRPLLLKLQGFYVKSHQKQIAKYYQHFKQHDRDDDGIIESDQIDKCISTFIRKNADCLSIYQTEQNMQNLCQEIMAKRRKKGNLISMTFSQFVSALRDYF